MIKDQNQVEKSLQNCAYISIMCIDQVKTENTKIEKLKTLASLFLCFVIFIIYVYILNIE